MADYGFTSHLLTIPVVYDSVTPASAEIQSVLGYEDKGVIQPLPAIGTPVVPSAAQPDDTIIRVTKMPTDGKPLGILATKLKYDATLNKFRADIKLFGITLEAFSATPIVVGSQVVFTADNVDAKYQLPVVAPAGATALGGQMVVVGTRNPETGVYISTVYIPTCDITNDGNRLLTMNAEKVKPEK